MGPEPKVHKAPGFHNFQKKSPPIRDKRFLSTSPGSKSIHQDRQSAANDETLKGNGPVLNVKLVKSRLSPRCILTVSISGYHLCETRNPGKNLKAISVLLNRGEIMYRVLPSVRTRPDNAHFSTENVKEVRQLVQTGPTKEDSQCLYPSFLQRRIDWANRASFSARLHRTKFP